MALCHSLYKRFGATHPIYPLIVNHGLRPEAPEEAERVANWLKDHGMNPVILHWHGPKPQKALQEKARFTRHRLLKTWCCDHKVVTLCLGHHQDDQQETRMMRLLGQSGLRGMEGMSPVVYDTFGRLLRPFLDLPKEALLFYCHKHQIPYVQDPSNTSPRFLRTHLRHLKDTHARLFLFPKIALSSPLEAWIGRFLLNHASFEKTSLSLQAQAFFSLPFTFQQEIILYLVMTWGVRKPYPPRRRSLDFIVSALKEGRKTSLRSLEFIRKKTYVLIKT
jgi:tRNA(Ile)-lysidine synthetase-like protein